MQFDMSDQKSKSNNDTIKNKFKLIPPDCIKTIAESAGFSHLPESCVQSLGEAVTFYLREVIQDSVKFKNHRKGRKLTCSDIDNAFKSKNIEPLYGFTTSEYIPFKYTSGGGREVHFLEEKEIDLKELTNSALPKIPHGVALKAHWLAIDGVQPSIPENPAPAQVFQLDVLNKNNDSNQGFGALKSCRVANNNPLLSGSKISGSKSTVQLKERFSHELCVEQQLYYKEITEAAVGSNEARRAEALNSLSKDPGLSQMLPRFSTFIAEGVRVNVAQNNLALLIYLMRMVKALMDNPSLNLEKYLHELNPAVMTCIVSKQLCSRPDHDNHWALRDYAARLMGQICKGFNTTTNQIQPRVSSIFCKSLHDDKSSLSTRYGCVAGLSELGSEVVQKFLLPRLKSEGEQIERVLENNPLNIDKTAAEHLRGLLVKHCSSVINKNLGGPQSPKPDPDEFARKYGPLSGLLLTQVGRLREQEAHKSRLLASTGLPARNTGAANPPRVGIPSSSFAASSIGGLPNPHHQIESHHHSSSWR